MDDTPDKLRRNVVALSAAIIAASFLHIELATQPKILGIDLARLDPVRFWICVTVALLYTSLRFHFNEETIILRNKLWEEFEKFAKRLLRQTLTREMERFLLQGHKPRLIVNPEAYSTHLARPPTEDSEIRLTEVTLSTGLVPGESELFEGKATFSITRIWSNGAKWHETGGASCIYRLTLDAKVKLAAYASLRLAGYSKSSVDALVPYALATIALIICFTKLLSLA